MGLVSSEVRASIQVDLNRIYLRYLRSICLVVSAYYGALTFAHFFFVSKEIVVPIAATAALTSICAMIIYIFVRLGVVTEAKSQVAFVPIGVAGLVTIFTHIFLSQDLLQLTNAVMAIFVFGFLTLSPSIFIVMISAASILYVVALVTIPGASLAHFYFLLVAANLLSILGFMLRYKTLYRSMRMLHGTRRKSRRLVAASHNIQAKMKEVEKANFAKDQFVANVTHELRTPLTGAMGMLDLLRDTKLSEEQIFMISTAQKSSQYLLNVVNDMLALGMIDAGKMEFNEEKVDLGAITIGAVDEFMPEASAKEISLSLGRQPDTKMYIRSDAARLSQILSKLIGNAVKFTEEGGVIVSLNWTPPQEAGSTTGSAVWRVADTGPGIPPESVDSMFNRFEQLDQTNTRRRSGTGLGLSIVQELVQLMGGTVG